MIVGYERLRSDGEGPELLAGGAYCHVNHKPMMTVNRKILGPTPSLLSSCIKPEDLQFAHQLSVDLPDQYETGRQK